MIIFTSIIIFQVEFGWWKIILVKIPNNETNQIIVNIDIY